MNTITKKYIKYPNTTNKRISEGGIRLKEKIKMSSQNNPLVTIITVCFNSEEYIEKCINSVIEQTYKNIEYIVIDGASSDKTIDIIKKYEDYIDYFVSEPDGGIYYAMNKGLELSQGDYIGILNSDDYYYDFAVQKSVETLLSSKADISAAYADIVNDEGITIGRSKLNDFDDTAFIISAPFNHQSMFASSRCYNIIGYFDTNFRIAADTKWILKSIENNFTLTRLNFSILAFTNSGTSSLFKKTWYEHSLVLLERFPNIPQTDMELISKFASGSVNDYKFENVYPLLFKYNFSENQKNFLYRKCFEVNPKICSEIFLLKDKENYLTIKNIENNNQHIKLNSKYIISPYSTEKRKAEGGLRLKQKFKKTLDGKPLVTVITYCKNSEKYIERSILSVLNQTYDNIEYIIIDSASTDNTLDIIKKYEDYIDYYVSETDDGKYFAINKALELASGDYISIISPNSYYFTDSIYKLLKTIIKEKTYYAIGVISYLDKNNSIIENYIPTEQSIVSIFNIKVSLDSILINKKCYDTIKLYNTDYKFASFFNFYTLLIKNNFKYSTINSLILYKNIEKIYYKDKLFLNEVYNIISKNTYMYSLDDIEFCVSLINDEIIATNFEEKLYKIMIKYNLTKSLYNELLLEGYKKEHRNIGKKSNSNIFTNLFSIKKSRNFIIVTILGIKISIRRKK